VAVTGLGEPANEDLVPSLEEEDLRSDPPPFQGSPHPGEDYRGVAGANVEDDGHPGKADRIGGHQIGQLAEELAREVIHNDVSQIFEQFGRRGLAGAGQAGDDDHVLSPLGRGRQRPPSPRGCYLLAGIHRQGESTPTALAPGSKRPIDPRRHRPVRAM
jgi:hypothetical protein